MGRVGREGNQISLDFATAALVQDRLKRQGLYDGSTDGVVGEKTVTGLQLHLNEVGHGLKVDGVAGTATVTALQTELKRRGFYEGIIDGVAGTLTRRAIHVYFSDSPQTDPKHALSSQAEMVSQIAERNGDQDYLMVDKINGKIFLFRDGRLYLQASALTGANLADVIPASSFVKGVDDQSFDEKVTPAGRFTVRKEDDPHYGKVFTLNEVYAPGLWSIAIHRVYTGTPSERRLERLQSIDGRDKHISTGCINVSAQTIAKLLKEITNDTNAPLYILPQDEARTLEFFPDRKSARRAVTPQPISAESVPN